MLLYRLQRQVDMETFPTLRYRRWGKVKNPGLVSISAMALTGASSMGFNPIILNKMLGTHMRLKVLDPWGPISSSHVMLG